MLSRVRVLVPTVTFVLIAALLVVPRANAAFTDGEDAAGAEIPALAGISGGTTTTDLPAEEELPVDAGTPVEVPTPLPAPDAEEFPELAAAHEQVAAAADMVAGAQQGVADTRYKDNYAQEDNLAIRSDELTEAQQAAEQVIEQEVSEAEAAVEEAEAEADPERVAEAKGQLGRTLDAAEAIVVAGQPTPPRETDVEVQNFQVEVPGKEQQPLTGDTATAPDLAGTAPAPADEQVVPQGAAVDAGTQPVAAQQQDPPPPAQEQPPAPPEGTVSNERYPQLLLPPEYAEYAASTEVRDVGLAVENLETATGFVSSGLAAGALSARGGPRGMLAGGFIGGSVGGVISGVGYRVNSDPVYELSKPGDEDNEGASIICTRPRNDPGAVLSCRPYSATTAVPFKGWEDRARAIIDGAGGPSTSAPQFTGAPVEGQPADYLAPEGWEGAAASDPWLVDTAARAAGACLSGSALGLGNLTRLRGLPIIPKGKEAAAVCAAGAAGELVRGSQANDRRVLTREDGSQLECTYARDYDSGEWKTYRECSDQVSPLPLPSLQSVLTTVGLDALTTATITLISRGIIRRFGGAPEVPVVAESAPAPPDLPQPVVRPAAPPVEFTHLPQRPKTGDIFEIEVPLEGVNDQLELRGVMSAEGNVLTMYVGTFYAASEEVRKNQQIRELLRLRTQLINEAKAHGFDRIRMVSQRSAGGARTSADPGRLIDFEVDLTQRGP
jgi:hypothetical protein